MHTVGGTITSAQTRPRTASRAPNVVTSGYSAKLAKYAGIVSHPHAPTATEAANATCVAASQAARSIPGRSMRRRPASPPRARPTRKVASIKPNA